MNIKEKILFLRDCGLTQAEIYLRTGISQSSVSKIENDEQFDVSYSKGVSLDLLVKQIRENKTTTAKGMS